MLVRALSSFPPATGGLVHAGDVFELPKDSDWLKAGIVEAAPKDAVVNRFIEPQGQAERPHQGLRNAVKEQMQSRSGGAPVTVERVEAGVVGVREKKAQTAKMQARKRAKELA